jgi:hypothetical protein
MLFNEVADLTNQGYAVTVNPALAAVYDAGVTLDDWTFTANLGEVLIRVSKGDYWLEVEKAGDADVEVEELDAAGNVLTDGTTERFRNEEIPEWALAGIREAGDGGTFVRKDGKTFLVTVRYNGWFETWTGKGNDRDLANYSDPEYGIDKLAGYASYLEERIVEIDAEVAA